MHSKIEAIEYYFPKQALTNDDLAQLYEGWSSTKIEKKTGIRNRYIAEEFETASDLAFHASKKLMDSGVCSPEEIDYLLFCTESPDYPLPPNACMLQHQLGLKRSVGAFDLNLGCSGFVYGLGVAHGLIVSGQAKRILLVTAETYSKYIHPQDRNVRTIFGDAAAATLIGECKEDGIGPFIYGTDGAGFYNLIVGSGGARAGDPTARKNLDGKTEYPDHLYMNGPEIFNFTIQAVPQAVEQLLLKANRQLNDIDRVVFHQANTFMLEHLRNKLNIPKEKFVIEMAETGNTVSSSIPIALKMASQKGMVQPGNLLLLLGFGLGYSWAGTICRW